MRSTNETLQPVHAGKKDTEYILCIKNRISNDERSDIVDGRNRIRDWEAVTIIGKIHKQAIVSLTERKSGLAFIYKMDR